MLVNESCASKPVELTTVAIVSLDTTSARASSVRSSPAKTFWAAMTSLDPDYARTHSVNNDERQFANALRTVMAGDVDEAELLLDSLARHAADSIVRSASHILLTATLQYQDKWRELAEIVPPRSLSADSTTKDDRAGVERWAGAFKNVPRRQISFASTVVTLPLSISAAGTPMIQVVINGKPKQFWLDTGSSMSIVASDVADECGVKALVPDTLEVVTTTGRVPARPAAIQRLELGGVSIRSATAMIVSSVLMEIRSRMDEPGPPVKIDGIVGFDIISQLDVQVDYRNGVVRLRRPQKSLTPSTQRNFFWVGTPIVRLVSQRGLPLHFGLDTGAQETYAMDRLINKVQVRTFLGDRKRIGGFAGLKEFRGRFIPDMRVSVGETNLIFQKLLVFTPAVSSFVALDGVLGSDAAKAGVMRIDAMNGVFSVTRQLPDQVTR